ncbi:MAG: YraN family protein [Acidobacteriota bacterium]|nr:YraN family protein [Acidobacteriota bacterium]
MGCSRQHEYRCRECARHQPGDGPDGEGTTGRSRGSSAVQHGCPPRTSSDRDQDPARHAREAGGLGSPRLRIDDVSPQELGSEGERLASRYLERRGYEVRERNWACPCGEVDIIAMDGDSCVLVEVKTRLVSGGRLGMVPELAVGERKQRRYGRIAACYMQLAGVDSVRFDVIAITIVADRTARLRHLVGAFECDA